MNFGLPNSMVSAIYKTFVYHHYLIISTNFFQYTEAKKNTNSHLPLSLIKLFFADWDHKVIPCEFFAAVVVIYHNKQFLIREKSFLRILNFLTLILGIWES